MKIFSLNNIKTGLMASMVAISAVSCGGIASQEKLCEKAEKDAVEYLTGEEYLNAKKNASATNSYSNKLVNYWDSINTEYKVQRAYLEGSQMVKDSVAGKDYVKPEYKMPERVADGIYIGYKDLVRNIAAEVSSFTDGKTMKQLIDNQPEISDLEYYTDGFSYKGYDALHYWNKVISIGKQREAFNKGADAERAKLNKK